MRVDSGLLTVLRLYDVANAIDLARVEQLAAAPSRIQLQRTAAKAISFDVPPVEFSLGQARFPLADTVRETECIARVYEFGAVAIMIRFSITDLEWADFTKAAQEVADFAGGDEGGRVWRELLDRLRRVIAPAMEKPNPAPVEEDYLILTAHRITPTLDAATFLEQVDVTPLLGGETRALSQAGRSELLRHVFSYYADDLVVLSWDRAFVLDTPEGAADIADVLELATAQLLELRYYDQLLDRELDRMYERVAQARGAYHILGGRRYASLARQLHRTVVEVTQITERVDNALKVTEDVYLARVYAGALELFRLRIWGATVNRKLAIMRDTYTALFDEAATARAELLELAIVVLIVFEIVFAFLA